MIPNGQHSLSGYSSSIEELKISMQKARLIRQKRIMTRFEQQSKYFEERRSQVLTRATTKRVLLITREDLPSGAVPIAMVTPSPLFSPPSIEPNHPSLLLPGELENTPPPSPEEIKERTANTPTSVDLSTPLPKRQECCISIWHTLKKILSCCKKCTVSRCCPGSQPKKIEKIIVRSSVPEFMIKVTSPTSGE